MKQRLSALAASLKTRPRRELTIPGFRESAVLMPLWLQDDPAALGDAHLLFTTRRPDLPSHAGQISFPGGKRDPADTSLVATALREAKEELGWSVDVEVLGLLDDVPTPAGFVITPVLGLLPGRPEMAPNQGEVADVFTAPLSVLSGLYQDKGTREFMGFQYVLHEYHYEDRRIWGATATLLYQLLGLLSTTL